MFDLVPEIKRREIDARDRWTLTADDLDRIAADLWPGVHGAGAGGLDRQGCQAADPPLTNEGRWALQRIEEHVNAIKHELGGLSERGLKGLAFEARRISTLENEALWLGVSNEAKRCEALRAALAPPSHRAWRVVRWSSSYRGRSKISARNRAPHGRACETHEPQGGGRGRAQADGGEGRVNRCGDSGRGDAALCAGMAAGGSTKEAFPGSARLLICLIDGVSCLKVGAFIFNCSLVVAFAVCAIRISPTQIHI